MHRNRRGMEKVTQRHLHHLYALSSITYICAYIYIYGKCFCGFYIAAFFLKCAPDERKTLCIVRARERSIRSCTVQIKWMKEEVQGRLKHYKSTGGTASYRGKGDTANPI
jgi:hypothetical protein